MVLSARGPSTAASSVLQSAPVPSASRVITSRLSAAAESAPAESRAARQTAVDAAATRLARAQAFRQGRTAGDAATDPLAAAACLAGIVFGTCSDFWQTYGTYPDACNHALVGSVANGGGCVSDFECVSLYCTPAAKCAAPT